MKRLLPLALIVFLLGGCTSVPDGVRPVHGFELPRYLGAWYEIARLDHRFERGLTDVSATYSPGDEGGIRVLNRGFDARSQTWKTAEGKAFFIGPTDIASLKVSFFGPFYGGYHIFALDPDYRWAMLSGPSRDYLWILARTPQLPETDLRALLLQARQAGFDTDQLIFPSHQRTGPGRP